MRISQKESPADAAAVVAARLRAALVLGLRLALGFALGLALLLGLGLGAALALATTGDLLKTKDFGVSEFCEDALFHNSRSVCFSDCSDGTKESEKPGLFWLM